MKLTLNKFVIKFAYVNLLKLIMKHSKSRMNSKNIISYLKQ